MFETYPNADYDQEWIELASCLYCEKEVEFADTAVLLTCMYSGTSIMRSLYTSQPLRYYGPL